MMVFLNGQFVPEAEAKVSVFDRSFLYGDALFETLLVRNGIPFRWHQHWSRLLKGADFLKLTLSYEESTLLIHARELIALNQSPNCLLRLHLSRGVGVRGYSAKGADQPLLILSTHPAPVIDTNNPPAWKLATCSLRIQAGSPLTQSKHANRLLQVLAKTEAEALKADDALLLSSDNSVVETSSANLFWTDGELLFTPPLSTGALNGITRQIVFELCQSLRIGIHERPVTTQVLQQSQGVFATLSSLGIVEITEIDKTDIRKGSPLFENLRRAYWALLAKETASP